ncbi:MAG: LemA family protein [Firmicutes bacterium]|nr:LemA family protein [Bacillota bacterium]
MGGWIAIAVVGLFLLLIVVLIGWAIGTYNKLVMGRNKVKNSWSQIDVQLKRRFDLIPNIVETVKGYATHEKSIFEEFAKARKLYDTGNSEGNVGKMAEANSQLTKLVALTVEQYPNLKADVQFIKLQETLSDTENKIAFARQFYNDVVLSFNNLREVFPSNIIANMFGFKEAELFKLASEEEKEAPKVKF